MQPSRCCYCDLEVMQYQLTMALPSWVWVEKPDGTRLVAHEACHRKWENRCTQLVGRVSPVKSNPTLDDADRVAEMSKSVAHLLTWSVGHADAVCVLTEALGVIASQNSDPLGTLTLVVEILADIRQELEEGKREKG